MKREALFLTVLTIVFVIIFICGVYIVCPQNSGKAVSIKGIVQSATNIYGGNSPTCAVGGFCYINVGYNYNGKDMTENIIRYIETSVPVVGSDITVIANSEDGRPIETSPVFPNYNSPKWTGVVLICLSILSCMIVWYLL